MTSYLAWAVGLLSLPLYALLFVMMRSGDWVYHEVLTPLTYVTLLTQILCLFFYRISAHAFSNSLFEGDICFENLSFFLSLLTFPPFLLSFPSPLSSFPSLFLTFQKLSHCCAPPISLLPFPTFPTAAATSAAGKQIS